VLAPLAVPKKFEALEMPILRAIAVSHYCPAFGQRHLSDGAIVNQKKTWRVVVPVLIGAAALLIGMPGTFAIDGGGSGEPGSGDVGVLNDIAPFTTVFNTDVVYAGVGGLRDHPAGGDITVSGVSGTVTKAFLYWHGPTNSSDPTINANVTLAGNAVVGTNIGLSSDNCWDFQNSQAYRADVTSIVSGNGTYHFVGSANDTANLNGASIAVFFNDGNPANNRDVVIFDGNDSNTTNPFDAPGWNVSLPGINYTSGSASMDMIVSDGQTFSDNALTLNGQTLVPTGGIFQGDTVPTAGGGPSNGFLWDQKSFDITSFLTPSPNTLTLTSGFTSDCLSLIVAAVNLPAGAAPNQPEHGSIAVTKTVVPPPGDPVVPVPASFTVNVHCNDNATNVDLTFPYAVGTSAPQTVSQIEAGKSCVVTEDQGGFEVSTVVTITPTGADTTGVTIAANQTTSVNVTNDFSNVTIVAPPVVLQPTFTG
jgi:hypothetical protein